MFSDETTFQNTGQLNRHNCHYLADVNPRWYRQIDNQHSSYKKHIAKINFATVINKLLKIDCRGKLIM